MQNNNTLEYLTRQLRPSHAALLAEFQVESDAVAAGGVCEIAYGPHPRQCFEFHASALPWRGTLAYFHAGFWQARDKGQFRFVTAPFLAAGIDVAMVNYPLCPDVTMAELTEAASASVPAVLAQAAALGRGGARLVAAGHSAGGHLAVELALRFQAVTGVVGLSGVYDLVPLLNTPLNDKLRLTDASAEAASPLHRLRAGLPPALFAVGGDETAAFQAQTNDMHAAWSRLGNPSQALCVGGKDHFSLLRALAEQGALMDAVLALF